MLYGVYPANYCTLKGEVMCHLGGLMGRRLEIDSIRLYDADPSVITELHVCMRYRPA